MDPSAQTPPPVPAEVPPPIPPPVLAYRNANPIAGALADGGLLVASNGTVLPCRCVKCNGAEGVKMVERRFSWYPPWVLLLVLVALLPGAIVASCLTKRATVSYGLCAMHRKRRMGAILLVWLGVMLSAALFVVGAAMEEILIMGVAMLVLLGVIVAAAVAVPILKPVRIADGVARLKGAGPEFLASL